MLCELFINPIGDFPLNDDWAYARSIFDYLNTGKLKFSFWQACPDLPQFFVGLSVCKIFGFSFTALRFISIVSIVLMIPIVNSITKLLEIESKWSFIIQLIFVFNPLTIALSNTFMSDIFQLFLLLILFQLMLVYFKKLNQAFYVLFISVSIIASLNRQIGIVFPLIFGIILLYNSKKTFRDMIMAVIPFILTYAAVLTYESTAKNFGIIPVNYNLQINKILNTITHPDKKALAGIVYYFITSTICLGLFIIPLTVSNTKTHFAAIKQSPKFKWMFVFYLLLVIAKMIFSGHMLPFVGNIFHQHGFGPLVLTGYNTDEPAPMGTLAVILSVVFNIAGAVSFFLAFFSIANKFQMDKKFVSGLFLILLFVFYLLPLCFSYANDRYLLVILPFLIFAYASSVHMEIKKLKFILCFGVLSFLAVIGTNDYMNFHKAKYKATSHLLNDLKISPNEIDGGFEFNGWHLGDPVKNYNPEHKDRWWWIDKDNFIVSPVHLAGYTIESEYKFSTCLPIGIDKLYVLKKEDIR